MKHTIFRLTQAGVVMVALMTLGASANAATSLEKPYSNAYQSPYCPSGLICLFTGEDLSGTEWDYRSGSGYQDVPPDFHDHVGSFYSGANGCFINWESDGTKESRVVHDGDYQLVYDRGFGGEIDAVGDNC